MKTKISIAIATLIMTSSVLAAPASSQNMERRLAALSQKTAMLQHEVDKLHAEVHYPRKMPEPQHATRKTAEPWKDLIKKSLMVTTSPYLGVRSAYDAHDLLVQLPTMNEDLRILEQRQRIENKLGQQGTAFSERPLIELSGALEGQLSAKQNYKGPSTTDVDLTKARLDTIVYLSPWVTGLFSLKYDNGPGVMGLGSRIGNSRIFLKRGFITIGNLNRSPMYFSLGQMNVPFGLYSGFMVNVPETFSMGLTNTRALLLGYSEQGFYGQAYGFRSDIKVGGSGLNDWGLNAGYEMSRGDINLDVGASYISNIADSGGMQNNGLSAPAFAGFGASAATEALVHRVPGVDLHAVWARGPYHLIAEYVTAARSFDVTNMSYNMKAATPRAFHGEAAYVFDVQGLPANVGIGYGHTWESLALNLPRQSYSAVFNISVFKNTIQSIEYRYEKNYGSSDVAGGNGGPDSIMGGGHRNSVTAQLGIYF